MITQTQKRVNIPRKKAKFCAHRSARDALTNGVFLHTLMPARNNRTSVKHRYFSIPPFRSPDARKHPPSSRSSNKGKKNRPFGLRAGEELSRGAHRAVSASEKRLLTP